MPLRIADAVPMWAEYLTGSGLAEGTIRRHTSAAGIFVAACQQVKGSGVTMGQVDPQCISRFFAAHQGGQGSRNNKLESIRNFLRWAERNHYLRPGFTAADLLDGYKTRKAERQPKHFIEASEFPAALDAAGERHPRDRAIVALALYTLGRQSEIGPLTLGNLDMAGRTVTMYRKKRDRWTETGMSSELASEMSEWLGIYAREFDYPHATALTIAHPEWPVAPALQTMSGSHKLKGGKQVCAMERVAKRVLTGLGVTTTRQGKSVDHVGEGMHTLRRSGARAMFQYLSGPAGFGRDNALLQVKEMLDHESPIQTLTYIGMDLVRNELNEWLRGNAMYGETAQPRQGTVMPFRRPA